VTTALERINRVFGSISIYCRRLIEALKIFNEIPAGVSGVVSEVLISTGDIVEYGKPMFHIRRPPQLRAGG
jgi:acetyl-CoA carboxylase biotin carboxyl carrier protein